jgi:hypothetical protein
MEVFEQTAERARLLLVAGAHQQLDQVEARLQRGGQLAQRDEASHGGTTVGETGRDVVGEHGQPGEAAVQHEAAGRFARRLERRGRLGVASLGGAEVAAGLREVAVELVGAGQHPRRLGPGDLGHPGHGDVEPIRRLPVLAARQRRHRGPQPRRSGTEPGGRRVTERLAGLGQCLCAVALVDP